MRVLPLRFGRGHAPVWAVVVIFPFLHHQGGTIAMKGEFVPLSPARWSRPDTVAKDGERHVPCEGGDGGLSRWPVMHQIAGRTRTAN